jgi:hypothetical protein
LHSTGRSVTLGRRGVAEHRGPVTSRRGSPSVDQQTQLLALVIALAVLAIAVVLILNRQRRDREDATRESPFGTSTEGEKRCPKCGMGNLWTDRTCITCGARLPG